MAFSLDCSSLSDFTILGSASFFSISPATGNPAPCLQILNNSFAAALHKDSSIICGVDGVEFDIMLAAGAYIYILVFANDNGAGQVLTFSNASNPTTGLRSTPSYNSGSLSTNASFVSSEEVTAANVFVKYRAYTRQVGSAYQIKVVRVDPSAGEIICLDWTAFVPSGSNFGPIARGLGISYLDNLRSFRTSQISGTALLSNGNPANSVVCYSTIAGQNFLVASAIPASDGSYTLSVNSGDYLVVALGPDGYRPQAHLVTAP